MNYGPYGMLGFGGPCVPAVQPPINGVKPYKYVVQAGDGPAQIARYFGVPGWNMPGNSATNGWASLRTANPTIPSVRLSGDSTSPQYVVCTLRINPGDLVSIPGDWTDPTDQSRLQYPTGTPPPPPVVPTCSDLQVPVDGQCLDCPPNSAQSADGIHCACNPGYYADPSGICQPITVPGTKPTGQVSKAGMTGFPWWALLAAGVISVGAVIVNENMKKGKRKAL